MRKSKRYRWVLQHISKVSINRKNLDQTIKKLPLSIKLLRGSLFSRFSRMIPKALSLTIKITYIKPSTRKWWILLVLPNTSEKAYSITTQGVKYSRHFSVAQIWAQPLLPEERLQSILRWLIVMLNYLILNQENSIKHCRIWWELLPSHHLAILNLLIRCRRNARVYRQQETWMQISTSKLPLMTSNKELSNFQIGWKCPQPT